MEKKKFASFSTVEEAALALGVCGQRVRTLIKQQRLRGAVKVGKQYLLPRTEVERFAQIPRKPGRPRMNSKELVTAG